MGYGHAKLLQHTGTQRIRLVMHDLTSRACLLNHVVHADPSAALTRAVSERDTRDRAFIFVVEDHATGAPVRRVCGLRFKTEAAASEFAAA
ncbi:hypothetical protein OFC55_31350, partial [Escherichia coli]|nr:hypothetical protein [Escherichia coli]